jgi:hypothetical protein
LLEKVSATRAEYEAIRAVATHFVVLPGHEDPSIEHVVQQTERSSTEVLAPWICRSFGKLARHAA